MAGSKVYGKGFWDSTEMPEWVRRGVSDAAHNYFTYLPESDTAVKEGIADGFHRWLDENKDAVLAAIAKEHIQIVSHEKLHEWLESLSDI